jgi:hypothetical protein
LIAKYLPENSSIRSITGLRHAAVTIVHQCNLVNRFIRVKQALLNDRFCSTVMAFLF